MASQASTTNKDGEIIDGDGDNGILLQQTLMSHDECFVYKVPPLAVASGGYKANDWNLANPLQTCGFRVERRNNQLFLLFTLENHTKLFCLCKIEGNDARLSIEPVTDSSRYFVCKIVSNSNNSAQKQPRTMTLGFGFRERDIALDLLGSLQQFKQSIERELKAKELASKTKAIKVLKDGEKMHISIPGKTSSGGRKSKSSSSGGGGNRNGGGPFLLRKPPPGAEQATASAQPPRPQAAPLGGTPRNDEYNNRRFSMTDMECPLKEMTISTDNDDGDNNSEVAVGNRSTAGDLDYYSTDDDGEANDRGEGAEGPGTEGAKSKIEDGDDGFQESVGAVGGGASTVDDTDDDDDVGHEHENDDDSFQFSDLNLDDLDDDDDDNDGSGKGATENRNNNPNDDDDDDDDDDDFGDFQGA